MVSLTSSCTPQERGNDARAFSPEGGENLPILHSRLALCPHTSHPAHRQELLALGNLHHFLKKSPASKNIFAVHPRVSSASRYFLLEEGMASPTVLK
jgi:hypothetical protein